MLARCRDRGQRSRHGLLYLRLLIRVQGVQSPPRPLRIDPRAKVGSDRGDAGKMTDLVKDEVRQSRQVRHEHREDEVILTRDDFD
jgi:hypothetical protein